MGPNGLDPSTEGGRKENIVSYPAAKWVSFDDSLVHAVQLLYLLYLIDRAL